MSFPFTKILIIGATSGIGLGLSEKFLAEGKSIIIVGRRSEQLSKFISAHPAESNRIASYTFDVSKLDEIPAWVTKVTGEHPDLDAVFINAGIQRGFNFSKPETVDLDIFGAELVTNYTAPVHLTTAFLPFLMAQNKPTALMYTTSGLAIVPLGRCPGYCATKAALHHFLIPLRSHLKETNVRVIEIAPPAVQTELHDEAVQPDIKNGRNIGMPLKDFVEETWEVLNKGDEYDEYPIGRAKNWWSKTEGPRRELLKILPQAPAGVESFGPEQINAVQKPSADN